MAPPNTATATRPDELATHHIQALHDQLAAYLHTQAPTPTPPPAPGRSAAEQLVDQVGPDAIAAAHTQHTAAMQARLAEQTEQLHRLAGGTAPTTAYGILAAARDQLTRRGWTRGQLRDTNGRVCLLGSLDATGTPAGHPARLAAERHMLAAIREIHPDADEIPAYNDEHALSSADASAMLARAGELALTASD